MIVTSTTNSSAISNSSSGQWNNVSSNSSNVNGNNHSNHNNSSNNQNTIALNSINHNGNNNTWSSNGGYGNKFEYNHWIRIPLEPIRAACLRYAKTFSKVEQAMGNRVFFQFDSEGIILRAQDKSTLAAAQKQFTQLSRINQIELLTNGLDQEEYRQVIMKDIKTQGKYGKWFVQLIPYDAFRGIAIQLKNFGYEEPLKQYEKYMKLYPKFAFLLCHEANFAAVKLELLKMLKATASTASSSAFKALDKERSELDQLEISQKGKKHEFQKNMNQSVQYVKKEEQKEKYAIKKLGASAEEDRLFDKEEIEEHKHTENYEIREKQASVGQDKDQNEKLESNHIIQKNENYLAEKDKDSDEEEILEWQIEQQRLRELSMMSREEKEDNFSGLLAELTSSALLEGNDLLLSTTNGSTEKDTNKLHNYDCQVMIGIQDSHRVHAHGLCILWALLSKKFLEEDMSVRVDKQQRVIIDGLDRYLSYELSALSFFEDKQKHNGTTNGVVQSEEYQIIIPYSQLSDCIQQIKNEDLQRICQNDLIRYTKDNNIDLEGNTLNVVLQSNLHKKLLEKHHQQPLSPIQKTKSLNEYSTYPSFDIKGCRLIQPLHGSQTAYIVEYRQQLFCLKILHRLSDRQLHNTLANFEEHLQGENQQLLQIYAIAVHEASSKPMSAAMDNTGMTQESQQKGQHRQSSQQLLQIQQQQMQQVQQQQRHIELSQNSTISQKSPEQQQQFTQPQQDSNECWDVFILSELKPQNLKSAIESKYFKLFSQSMSAAVSLAIAVKNLHEKQVHHGNLKPNNVLFDADFNVILADIAQEHKHHSASALQPNSEKQQQHQQSFQQQQQQYQSQQQQQLQSQLQQSPSSFSASPASIYLAPELVKGGDGKLPRSDARSDIWSLGFLLFELFSALPGFNKTELPKKKKKRASSSAADDIQKAIAAMKVLISKCHAKNPFARPPIKDVLSELKDISKSIQE